MSRPAIAALERKIVHLNRVATQAQRQRPATSFEPGTGLPDGLSPGQVIVWDGDEWGPAAVTPAIIDGGLDLVVIFNNQLI